MQIDQQWTALQRMKDMTRIITTEQDEHRRLNHGRMRHSELHPVCRRKSRETRRSLLWNENESLRSLWNDRRSDERFSLFPKGRALTGSAFNGKKIRAPVSIIELFVGIISRRWGFRMTNTSAVRVASGRTHFFSFRWRETSIMLDVEEERINAFVNSDTLAFLLWRTSLLSSRALSSFQHVENKTVFLPLSLSKPTFYFPTSQFSQKENEKMMRN